MTDNDDDLDNEDDATDSNASAPKALRAQVKKLNQQMADLLAENSTLKKDQRKRSVAEALEGHGANPRLAKFYDKDEASPDDVLAWLKENGEDFGWSDTSSQQDDDDPDTMEEARRISRATSSAPQKALGRTVTAEFIKTASREDLIKMGLL